MTPRLVSAALVVLLLAYLAVDAEILTPAADWVERLLLAAIMAGGIGAATHAAGHTTENAMLAFFAAPRHAWSLTGIGLGLLIAYRHVFHFAL